MIIIDETTDVDVVLEIIDAQYRDNYKIQIVFNDDKTREIDFKNFLQKSLHPDIKKYLAKNIFRQFKILNGNINWNDYDMIFPLEDLYEGNIS